MPMMGSGRRGLQPDEIPPIFWVVILMPILIAILALTINFLHHSQSAKDRGVVDAYKKIMTQRMRSRGRGGRLYSPLQNR